MLPPNSSTLHGQAAWGSIHKRVSKEFQSCRNTESCGRGKGHQQRECRMPKPHSDGLERTLVLERSDYMHRNNIRHTWRVHPDSPRKEGLKE